MPRHKDFGSGTSAAEIEPVTFTLAGETFTCHPAVQGYTILKFVADADSDDGGRAAGAIYEFFKSAMPEEEYAKFTALITRTDVIFSLNNLADIAAWLTEEYTARPTQPPASSGSGL